MFEPYYHGHFDPRAFPAAVRAASLIASVLVIGALLLQTMAGGT